MYELEWANLLSFKYFTPSFDKMQIKKKWGLELLA